MFQKKKKKHTNKEKKIRHKNALYPPSYCRLVGIMRMKMDALLCLLLAASHAKAHTQNHDGLNIGH